MTKSISIDPIPALSLTTTPPQTFPFLPSLPSNFPLFFSLIDCIGSYFTLLSLLSAHFSPPATDAAFSVLYSLSSSPTSSALPKNSLFLISTLPSAIYALSDFVQARTAPSPSNARLLLDFLLRLPPLLSLGQERLLLNVFRSIESLYKSLFPPSTLSLDFHNLVVELELQRKGGLTDTWFISPFKSKVCRLLPCSIITHAQLPMPFDWLFMVCHPQARRIATSAEIASVLSAVRNLAPSGNASFTALSSIPVASRLIHLMHLYVLGAETFFDPAVETEIAALLLLFVHEAVQLNKGQKV